MKTVEEHLEEWAKQPGAVVTPEERCFISIMRCFRRLGVGYGWMKQIIDWEWESQEEKTIGGYKAKRKCGFKFAGGYVSCGLDAGHSGQHIGTIHEPSVCMETFGGGRYICTLDPGHTGPHEEH